MDITTLLAISLGAILTNNFIFAQFLGICPFLGVSKKIDTAVGMGAAVTFVMGLASSVFLGVSWFLVAAGLGFMQTVAYILVIASLVQFVEMFLKKNIPTLYTALGAASLIDSIGSCDDLVSELERKEFDYESYDIIDYKYEPPFNPYSLFQMAAKKLSNTATTDIEAGINLLKGAEMSYPAYYCNVLD